jgi:hypothetical protein
LTSPDASDSPHLDSLAIAICRLGLDPASGRLRRRTHLGIAIRAGLFAELAIDGRLAGGRAPHAIGPSETGAGMSDSLHRAVAGRRPTQWRRWFGHVGADVDAATQSLVDAGVWHPEAGGFVDADADRILAQSVRIEQFLTLAPAGTATASAPVADIVLALLVGGAGVQGARPRPRAQLRQLPGLLPESEPHLEVLRATARSALIVMRKHAGLRILSG